MWQNETIEDFAKKLGVDKPRRGDGRRVLNAALDLVLAKAKAFDLLVARHDER